MKVFYTAMLLFITFNPIYAQEEFKKIIYEDLIFLNDLYNSCVIQFDQKKLIIKGNDTITNFETIKTIRHDFNKVTLTKIDSINGFYFIDAKFDLIPNPRYVGLFSNHTFSYILYKTGENYYKINGFFISEILLTHLEPELISTFTNRIGVPKKFNIYVKRRNLEKIRKLLSVSVLKEINQLGFQFDDKPYVKDIICY